MPAATVSFENSSTKMILPVAFIFLVIVEEQGFGATNTYSAYIIETHV